MVADVNLLEYAVILRKERHVLMVCYEAYTYTWVETKNETISVAQEMENGLGKTGPRGEETGTGSDE